MARKPIITTHGSTGPSQRVSSAAYYLATTEDVMRFYCFDVPSAPDAPMAHELIDCLDRRRLTGAGNRETARAWAKRLGLTAFTYVRV